MKIALLSILSVFVLLGCGSEPDGPLQDHEVEKIEDDLVEAIGKKKIKLYSDKSLEHLIDPLDFEILVPKDSLGRQDIAGFSAITEQEVALNKGDFSNESTEIEAIALYVLFEGTSIQQYLPIALVSWKDVEKVLSVNQTRRFNEYLLGHFQTNISTYDEEIAKLRLEFINEKLFTELKSGNIAAYDNDNLASVKSPAELETFLAHKEEQMVPDPNIPDETILTLVDIPISAQDITHYLPAYDEDENIIAITMMITENIQHYPLNQPWIAMDIDEVKKVLEPSVFDYLIKRVKEFDSEKEETPADSLELNN